MITVKSQKEIETLKEGGARLAEIMRAVLLRVKAGVTTDELDEYALELIQAGGDIPSFLNYRPEGMRKMYPKSICVSINDEVVHGIPGPKRILKDGDVVSVDIGLIHKGLFTDHARTVVVGEGDKEIKRLVLVTEKALKEGIRAAKPGNTIGDIGYAIEKYVKPYGYGIVRELSGHGVGYAVHEDPYVPNYGKPGTGPKLVPGMVLAIEPMLIIGSDKVIFGKDGFTVRSKNGAMTAHFEDTIVITNKGPVLLTK
jgi:methionyl aminopeptidase